MGQRVDPQLRCLAAADAAIKQINFRRHFREQRIERLIEKLEPRQFGIAQIDDDVGAFGGFDTRLMDRLFQRRRRLCVCRRGVLRFATPHAVHTVLRTGRYNQERPSRNARVETH
jgi:hypothetical protein